MINTLELSSFTQLKELIDSGLLVDIEKKDDSSIRDDTENLYNVVNLRTKTGANILVALVGVDLLITCEYLYYKLDIFQLVSLSNFVSATIAHRKSGVANVIYYEVCLNNPSRLVKGYTPTEKSSYSTIQILCKDGLNKCDYEGESLNNGSIIIERVYK